MSKRLFDYKLREKRSPGYQRLMESVTIKVPLDVSVLSTVISTNRADGDSEMTWVLGFSIATGNISMA